MGNSTMLNCVVDILQKKFDISDLTVLSLGCGIGITESRYKWKHITGIDVWNYKDASVDKFIQHDIRYIKEIIKNKSFDLVLCLDIIEHLKREEGFELIKNAEDIGRKAIIFYTPIKWNENIVDETCWAFGNPYNLHQSLWSKEDFMEYEIYKLSPSNQSEPEGFLAVKYFE